MKKILYIQNNCNVGGISTVISAKANWLVSQGYGVSNLFTHYKQIKEVEALYSEGIKSYTIPLSLRNSVSRIPLVGRLLWFVYFRVAFVCEIIRINPDIIVSTYDHLEPTSVILLTFWKRRFLEFHGMRTHKAKSVGDWIKYKFRYRFYKLVCLTQDDAKEKLSVIGRKTIVIPNPITCDMKTWSTCEKKKAIIPARFSPQKGLVQFLPYWKQIEEKHPDWELHLWGDGEEKDALMALKEKYALKTVFFNGYTNEVIKKISDSSIMLLPSMYEGFPTTLVEAMTCGVPCVAFDCKYGPRDIIHDGEDGCLVEYKNYEQFIGKIDMLISDDSLRKTMGEKARKNIRRYRLENVMPKWEEVFDK